MIEREKKITIGEKSFIVKFPNVGQIISLESAKQALTDNRYGQMAASGVASMYYALDLVDTIAFFQVCGAEILKFFDIKNIASVAPDKLDMFVETYAEQIKPWLDKTFDELRGLSVKKTDNGEKGDSGE